MRGICIVFVLLLSLSLDMVNGKGLMSILLALAIVQNHGLHGNELFCTLLCLLTYIVVSPHKKGLTFLLLPSPLLFFPPRAQYRYIILLHSQPLDFPPTQTRLSGFQKAMTRNLSNTVFQQQNPVACSTVQQPTASSSIGWGIRSIRSQGSSSLPSPLWGCRR